MQEKQPNSFEHFGGRSSITWSMWVLTIPLSVVLTFAFMPSGLEGHVLTIFMISLIAHTATGLTLFVGRLLFLSEHSGRTQKTLTVTIFALSGVARGFTVGELSVRLKIESEHFFAYRIPSSIVVLVFTFVLLSTVISNGKSNRFENSRLEGDIAKLKTRKTEAKEAIRGIRDQVLAAVQKILSAHLAQTSSSEQISAIAEKMIRPLGHRLFLNNSSSRQLGEETAKNKRLRPKALAALVGSLVVAQPFNVSIVALAEIFIPLSLKIYTLGLGLELAISLTPIIIPISIIAIAKSLQLKQVRDTGVGFSLPKVIAIWLLAASSSAIVSNAIPVFHTYIPNPGLYALLQFSLFLLISALFFGLQVEQLKLRNNLLITSESLRLQEASLKRQLVLEEKRLGKIIHGEIQARLIVLASQLRRNEQDSDQPDPGFEAQVQLILEQAFKQIQGDAESAHFTEAFEKLIHLWEPVLQINSKLQDEALTLLGSDPLISVAVLEVVGEGLTNAFRHGNASSADIDITYGSSNELIIKVRDNGSFSKVAGQGLGSKLLDELSNDWQITPVDGATELTVRIELAP
jgi:signal transduction histidine kinase